MTAVLTEYAGAIVAAKELPPLAIPAEHIAFYDLLRLGQLGRGEFTFKAAIRAAWIVIEHRVDREAAVEEAANLIKVYKRQSGLLYSFNVTWTRFYCWMVALAVVQRPGVSWEAFWAYYAVMYPREVWCEYYQVATWRADKAKRGWVEPDRRKLGSLRANVRD